MRFERKYRIEGMSQAALQQIIRLHPASFRSLYPDRQVNNIYLDTPQLTTFQQNVNGFNQRKKYRIRWYGNKLEQADFPQFEIKTKHNELGEKKNYELKSFERLDLSLAIQQIHQLHPEFSALQASLMNTYERSYLISFDGKFRLTIDRNLAYYSHKSQQPKVQAPILDPALILEIKYEQKDDSFLDPITQYLPFRQQKHSKYVQGVQLVFGF